MDPRVNQEWTAFEIEEARSLIASLSNNGDHHEDGNDDKNKKHNDIVAVLHAWFPWKTMQQVTSLYVDLVVEMHTMKWQEENNAIEAHDVCPRSGVMNDSFGMPEAAVQEAMGNERFLFDCPLSEEMGTTKMDETPAVEENRMEMLENQAVHQLVAVAPHTGRYWSTEEHRLFLHGLRVYGRGDWKNISKYFVTTRTPVQVSSHAQKYFRRLESSASERQRYSINDVGLHDADPWMMEKSWEALTFAGGHLNPALGQAPASSFVTTNNIAQLWSPLLYHPQASQPAWSEQQQMVVSASAPMEGAWNFVPDGQQGAYLPTEQWMNNMH